MREQCPFGSSSQTSLHLAYGCIRYQTFPNNDIAEVGVGKVAVDKVVILVWGVAKRTLIEYAFADPDAGPCRISHRTIRGVCLQNFEFAGSYTEYIDSAVVKFYITERLLCLGSLHENATGIEEHSGHAKRNAESCSKIRSAI